MSLISEGLKKAHLETLRQDRENRRQYFSPGRSDVPSRRSRRGAILAAAFGGAILAAAVTAAWISNVRADFSSARGAETAKTTSMDREAATAGTIDAEPRGPVTMTAGTVVDAPRDATTTVAPNEAGRLAPIVEARSIPTPAVSAPRSKSTSEPAASDSRAAVAESSEIPREPAERSGPARHEGLVNGESYASPVRSPGGGEVRLSGISSSKGQSLAIINGNIVREGEAVGPFVVEKIERGRVRLRYVDIRFWLSY